MLLRLLARRCGGGACRRKSKRFQVVRNIQLGTRGTHRISGPGMPGGDHSQVRLVAPYRQDRCSSESRAGGPNNVVLERQFLGDVQKWPMLQTSDRAMRERHTKQTEQLIVVVFPKSSVSGSVRVRPENIGLDEIPRDFGISMASSTCRHLRGLRRPGSTTARSPSSHHCTGDRSSSEAPAVDSFSRLPVLALSGFGIRS